MWNLGLGDNGTTAPVDVEGAWCVRVLAPNGVTPGATYIALHVHTYICNDCT